MTILREDASASHMLPYQVHNTTMIDENGYFAYGINVNATKATSKTSKRDIEDEKKQLQLLMDKRWLQHKRELDALDKTHYEKLLSQRAYAQEAIEENAYISSANFIG